MSTSVNAMSTNYNWFTVNMKLLPIKAHYFFLFGGMAGTIAFLPLFSKGLGFNATAVGIIYTLIPVFNFLSKFIFGYLTDLFRNIKLTMMILAAATTAFIMLVLLVPAVDTTRSDIQVKAVCINNSSQLTIKSINRHSDVCLPRYENRTRCYLISSTCFASRVNKSMLGELKYSNFTFNEMRGNETCLFIANSNEELCSQSECHCLEAEYSYIKCMPINESEGSDSSSIYLSYNFWLLLTILITSGCGVAAIFCLTDAACYEVLGEQSMLYGRQRLWGTLSWGIVTLMTGYLNDMATGVSSRIDYSPGFYIMLIFMVIDLVILYRLQVAKANASPNIFKDVGKIFAFYKTTVFAVTVYICGAFTGLLWHYQFWYLEDLGASHTLLGLVTAVQCLIAEVPFFFFSGWVIEKLRHFNCMLVVFVAFALRIGLYAVLINPWSVLPIELLHGITYALLFSTLTDFAAENALPGTEVTTLGVLEGIFEGLGVATGSLLGGIGFDRIGGRMTFFTASMISLVCIPLLAIARIFIKRTSKENQIDPTKPADENCPERSTENNCFEMNRRE